MRKVLIVTHIKFWEEYSGDGARLNALIDFLKDKVDLTIAYGGLLDSQTMSNILHLQDSLRIEVLGESKVWDISTCLRLFKSFIAGRSFDVCIIEHAFLSFLISVIPSHVTLMLDAHDIVSERVESFKKMGREPDLMTDISPRQELMYFKKFDHVILIQRHDHAKISKLLGRDKTILAPHPVIPRQLPLREQVRTIGFVASAYPPNIDSIHWFLDQVWPSVRRPEIALHIYGTVCREINADQQVGVVLKWTVPDLAKVYNELDIVINPVRFGAGLKIKNIEAMGNGLPLITTTHGASGMEEGAGKAFLVAEDAPDFISKLADLFDHFQLRQELGEKAFLFVKEKFSPEVCFGPLLAKIYESSAIDSHA